MQLLLSKIMQEEEEVISSGGGGGGVQVNICQSITWSHSESFRQPCHSEQKYDMEWAIPYTDMIKGLYQPGNGRIIGIKEIN